MKSPSLSYGFIEFNNKAVKLTFAMGSHQLYQQRQQTAKCTHDLVPIITLLSSSPEAEWNPKKTEGLFNTLVQCASNTHRNKHNSRKQQM